MSAFLLILFLLFFIIVAIVWLSTGRILFWSIYASARRLKLRDRGEVGTEVSPSGGTLVWVDSFCRTRLRIGITEEGESVRYCWRCERIIDDSSGDDGPKGKEPIPEEASDNVVKLFGT